MTKTKSWICNSCGLVCTVTNVFGSFSISKPIQCPRGLECKWVKQRDTNTRGINEYVEWRTKNVLDGCTSGSVYEDYLEFCEKNNIKNPHSHIGLIRNLVDKHGFKVHSVRDGDKVYRVLLVM